MYYFLARPYALKGHVRDSCRGVFFNEKVSDDSYVTTSTFGLLWYWYIRPSHVIFHIDVGWLLDIVGTTLHLLCWGDTPRLNHWAYLSSLSSFSQPSLRLYSILICFKYWKLILSMWFSWVCIVRKLNLYVLERWLESRWKEDGVMSPASCARGGSNELSPHSLACPAITLKLLVCSGILDNLALNLFSNK